MIGRARMTASVRPAPPPFGAWSAFAPAPWLGQVVAEKKLYWETGDCGVVTGGWGPFSSSSGRACKGWTYSELGTAFSTPTDVKASDQGNKVIRYWPTPGDLLKEKGLCDTLHGLFLSGFWIPWSTGTQFIEPGVYFPDKTWAQMVDESNTLRAGGGTTDYDFCIEGGDDQLSTYTPSWSVGSDPKRGYTFTLYDENGGRICSQGGGGTVVGGYSSFSIPLKYRTNSIVLATVAMWLGNYSKRGPKTLPESTEPANQSARRVWCQRSTERTSTDPQWGHSYKVHDVAITRIASDGVQRGTRRFEGPIVGVTGTKEGGNLFDPATSFGGGYSPQKIRALAAAGQWPTPTMLSLTQIDAKWTDNNAPIDKATLFTLPTAGQAPPAGGATTAGVMTFGIVATVIALVASQLFKKKDEAAPAAAERYRR